MIQVERAGYANPVTCDVITGTTWTDQRERTRKEKKERVRIRKLEEVSHNKRANVQSVCINHKT
jgi:hypothetical protein